MKWPCSLFPTIAVAVAVPAILELSSAWSAVSLTTVVVPAKHWVSDPLIRFLLALAKPKDESSSRVSLSGRNRLKRRPLTLTCISCGLTIVLSIGSTHKYDEGLLMADPEHIKWLLQGRLSWNKRRKEQHFIPDLSGEDIAARFVDAQITSGEGIADLAGIDLS